MKKMPFFLRRGFTFIEVLAAVTLAGIVLPAAVGGISLASSAVSDILRRSEAAELASFLAAGLLLENGWDFEALEGTEHRGASEYRWRAVLAPWEGAAVEQAEDLAELTVTVSWKARGEERESTVSTLVRAGGAGFSQADIFR